MRLLVLLLGSALVAVPALAQDAPPSGASEPEPAAVGSVPPGSPAGEPEPAVGGSTAAPRASELATAVEAPPRSADPPVEAVGAPDAAAPEPAPAPAAPYRPYSIAWNLRPLPSVTVIRLDQSFALHDAYGRAASGLDATVAQLITLGLRCNDWLMLVARWGWAWRAWEGDVAGSTILLGANFATRPDATIRLNFFVASTVPTGGTNGQPANRDGRLARAAMDNAMFLPGHLAVVAGVALAWIDQGWTVHGEATLFTLPRVTAATDDVIVNSTFGIHVGYFVLPELSVSGELHHQHFLTTPAGFARDDFGEDLRSQSSMTLGIRGHFRVDGSAWIRPGLAYTFGLDDPMLADAWQILQLDVPILF